MIEAGQRYGTLTVLRRDEEWDKVRKQGGPVKWICQCDCGTIRSFKGFKLSQGRTRSCGCRGTGRGHARPYFGTDTYQSWHSMHKRCGSRSNIYYGARGISVCERWKDFALFLQDMGERPSKQHSLERIDPNGNYEPGNVRWATAKEQAQNRRNSVKLTFMGEELTVSAWSERLGIDLGTLWSRIRAGRPVEEVLSKPVGPAPVPHEIEYLGVRDTLGGWARRLGVDKSILRHRINRYGWSPEKAVATPVRLRRKAK